MAALIGRAVDALAERFELARGGAGTNLYPMEGLRGFAVFLVFVVHFATLIEPWLLPRSATAQLLEAAHTIGNAGVDLFFVLSGYLIYGHLIERAQPFRRYFGRRVRRIYPAFLAVFALYVALALISGGKLPHEAVAAVAYLVANLLLLPGILPLEPLITVAWSLSYEMFYYLAMPALIVAFGLRRRSPLQRIGFFSLLTVLACCLVAAVGGPFRLIMFLAGVLLHDVRRRWPDFGVTTVAALSALALCLGGLLLPLSGSVGQTLRVLMLSCGFFIVCLACFSRPASGVGRLFSWTPLRWLGNMSYSYYLIHGLTLKVFLDVVLAAMVPPLADGRLGLAMVLPSFLVTLLPSAFLYLWVERPFSLASPATPAPR